MTASKARQLPVGTRVTYWPGTLNGLGRLGEVKYAGGYVIGGTEVLYLNRGAVALTHIEIAEQEQTE